MTADPSDPERQAVQVQPAASLGRPALLDHGVLRELEAEAPGAARRFAAAYTRLWEHRHARIIQALARPDCQEALDAVLSLKAASAMVGATALAQAARRLEAALRCGDADTPALSREISRCGRETVAALRADLALPG